MYVNIGCDLDSAPSIVHHTTTPSPSVHNGTFSGLCLQPSIAVLSLSERYLYSVTSHTIALPSLTSQHTLYTNRSTKTRPQLGTSSVFYIEMDRVKIVPMPKLIKKQTCSYNINSSHDLSFQVNEREYLLSDWEQTAHDKIYKQLHQ